MAVIFKEEDGKEEPLPEQNIMILPPDKEHLASFPSGCSVIHTVSDTNGGVACSFGIVEWAAIDLVEERCRYKVKPLDGNASFIASDEDLHYGPGCPVWVTAPGSVRPVPATVLKSYQKTAGEAAQYALQEVRSPIVHAGILRDVLKYRTCGDLPQTATSVPIESPAAAAAVTATKYRLCPTANTDPTEWQAPEHQSLRKRKLSGVDAAVVHRGACDSRGTHDAGPNSQPGNSQSDEFGLTNRRRTSTEGNQGNIQSHGDANAWGRSAPVQTLTEFTSPPVVQCERRKMRRITIPAWADYKLFERKSVRYPAQ